jgi:hypothetical protein
LKEYILEVKKVIPKVLCEKIIHYFDNNYSDALTTNSDNPDKNTRNCLTRSVLETRTFGEKICSNAIKEKIFQCVNHYKDKHGVDINKISQLDILKYEANEYKAGFNFHYDFGPTCHQRHLSISISLNNEYEGGEFVFNTSSDQLVIPQNIGDAVIFPSNFMFPHQVNKITKGIRYALIAWVI